MTPPSFATQLRDMIESKYKSIPRFHAALRRAYGDEAVSIKTIRRLMDPAGYRPRGRVAYAQLKRVLPDLVFPNGAVE